MTRIFLQLAVVAGVAAATITSANAQGCTDQMAKDWLAGWSHDLPKLTPLIADDIVNEDTTAHNVLHGKKEVEGYAQGWFRGFPDINFALKSTLISGNRMAVGWQATGTQTGEMMGMPASNKAATVVGVSLMECADGKITSSVGYWDMATLLRQLGFMPSPTQ